MPTAAPKTITSRAHAAQLWRSLLDRGISFHWEDDPADWVNVNTGARTLTTHEARETRRLFKQVAKLDDERCYADALRLFKRALTGKRY